jgi:hypothetical protein
MSPVLKRRSFALSGERLEPMARIRLFAVLALVVLSGCTLPVSLDEFDTDREYGQIGDYTADDEFAFGDEATLTEAELEAVTYRAMARVETLRELKFEQDIELEVLTREEYREEREARPTASPFANEFWRGTFVVGGETDVNAELDHLYGEAVRGYYSSDRIVLVVDDSDEIRVDRATLVHELVHALQDQHFGLQREGTTIDERRAELGLLEGEANYIPYLYEQRCETEWQCLPDPEPTTAELDDRPFNTGLFLSIYAPYSEGPPFVAHLHETGGWEAVDRAHADRPASTAQLIRPEFYPDEIPVDIEVRDRSTDDWAPIKTGDGEVRTETIGEATLFSTLWANGVIDRELTEGATELSPYNYSHPATSGWTGDSFTVYQNGDNQTAHVWTLAWESEADAEAFADAYQDLLDANGADAVENDGATDAVTETVQIDDGEAFAGAYRLAVVDDTAEIVGAPHVDDLEAVHATESEAIHAAALEPVHATPGTSAGIGGDVGPSSAATAVGGLSISSGVSATNAAADG